jgi:hypothetical protein
MFPTLASTRSGSKGQHLADAFSAGPPAPLQFSYLIDLSAMNINGPLIVEEFSLFSMKENLSFYKVFTRYFYMKG